MEAPDVLFNFKLPLRICFAFHPIRRLLSGHNTCLLKQLFGVMRIGSEFYNYFLGFANLTRTLVD